MKIYLVRRIDPVGYDEYDSFVVIAKDVEDAIEITKMKEKMICKEGVVVEEITKIGNPKIILGSFNAG